MTTTSGSRRGGGVWGHPDDADASALPWRRRRVHLDAIDGMS